MEKRIGTITILIRAREAASAVNGLLSEHSNIILCRQGLPFREREVAVISLIVEGSVDSINALTGKLGRVEGVECKAVVTKNS
jgi:putative iron-only hydrogenase system regulator